MPHDYQRMKSNDDQVHLTDHCLKCGVIRYGPHQTSEVAMAVNGTRFSYQSSDGTKHQEEPSCVNEPRSP